MSPADKGAVQSGRGSRRVRHGREMRFVSERSRLNGGIVYSTPSDGGRRPVFSEHHGAVQAVQWSSQPIPHSGTPSVAAAATDVNNNAGDGELYRRGGFVPDFFLRNDDDDDDADEVHRVYIQSAKDHVGQAISAKKSLFRPNRQSLSAKQKVHIDQTESPYRPKALVV